MPTILEWAGMQAPGHLHGSSFAPWLQGETPAWRETYYVENITRYQRRHQWCLQAAQSALALETPCVKQVDLGGL
jgi:arylsulfatase A-like enzyme